MHTPWQMRARSHVLIYAYWQENEKSQNIKTGCSLPLLSCRQWQKASHGSDPHITALHLAWQKSPLVKSQNTWMSIDTINNKQNRLNQSVPSNYTDSYIHFNVSTIDHLISSRNEIWSTKTGYIVMYLWWLSSPWANCLRSSITATQILTGWSCNKTANNSLKWT